MKKAYILVLIMILVCLLCTCAPATTGNENQAAEAEPAAGDAVSAAPEKESAGTETGPATDEVLSAEQSAEPESGSLLGANDAEVLIGASKNGGNSNILFRDLVTPTGDGANTSVKTLLPEKLYGVTFKREDKDGSYRYTTTEKIDTAKAKGILEELKFIYGKTNVESQDSNSCYIIWRTQNGDFQVNVRLYNNFGISVKIDIKADPKALSAAGPYIDRIKRLPEDFESYLQYRRGYAEYKVHSAGTVEDFRDCVKILKEAYGEPYIAVEDTRYIWMNRPASLKVYAVYNPKESERIFIRIYS